MKQTPPHLSSSAPHPSSSAKAEDPECNNLDFIFISPDSPSSRGMTWGGFCFLVFLALIIFSAPALAESAYSRVMKTQTIKCGYVNYEPGSVKDAATGAIKGIAPDIIESAAKQLGFKVEWVEETTWGVHLEGLKTKKYDMLCSASFALPSDTLWSETVGPLYYSTIGVWVRPDDKRFVNNYDAINNKNVIVSAIDGTIPAIIAAEDFPQANIVSQPQFTDYALNMLNVAQGKADVTFVETWQGNAFAAKNPNKLVNIGADKPLRVYHNFMLVGKGEFELQSMLNTVIKQMHDNGQIEKIIQKYEGTKGSLLRVAPGFVR